MNDLKKRFVSSWLTLCLTMIALWGCAPAMEAAPETGQTRYEAHLQESEDPESTSLLAETQLNRESQMETLPDGEQQTEGQTEEQGAESGKPQTLAEESFQSEVTETTEKELTENGSYNDRESVALYLHLYGHLPDNYITKGEAENLGWDSQKGNLDEVAPGRSIGGGRFGNREGLLPKQKGRIYYECDIDYDGGYRGGKRIVYSNDGLIYYTEDHYKSFELLYTKEGEAP